MFRILLVTYELNYKIEFQTAILVYHVYKDIWVSSIGHNSVCKTDTWEKAIEYDKIVIGIFKSGNKEALVGHLPIEISCFLTKVLNAAPENKLDAIVAGKRKREVGAAVPVKHVPLTKNKTFGNVLLKKLQKKKIKTSKFLIWYYYYYCNK